MTDAIHAYNLMTIPYL